MEDGKAAAIDAATDADATDPKELKNLRPQLYSATEYCEKSYLHSEQKQMVLDNLKDYVVRALVNAIDHLGTVAYEMGDILEQQTLDMSKSAPHTMTMKQIMVVVLYFHDKFTYMKGAGLLTIMFGVSLFNWYENMLVFELVSMLQLDT